MMGVFPDSHNLVPEMLKEIWQVYLGGFCKPLFHLA